MNRSSRLGAGLLAVSLALLACGSLTPTSVAPGSGVSPSAVATVAGIAEPTLEPTAEVPATAAPSPSPTTAPLELEVVQSQTWVDRFGNTRVNVLVRNPYDYPVKPLNRGHASLISGAGDLVRAADLYFLDGISGGGGFVLPGETVAANACFTCEALPLPGPWETIRFDLGVSDATDQWKYATEVEATLGKVTFNGDSPIFDITGSVKNTSDSMIQRISVRVFVYDEAGQLVGAGEASVWDVGPGAVAEFSSYGTGETPDGPFETEVTALGVTY